MDLFSKEKKNVMIPILNLETDVFRAREKVWNLRLKKYLLIILQKLNKQLSSKLIVGIILSRIQMMKASLKSVTTETIKMATAVIQHAKKSRIAATKEFINQSNAMMAIQFQEMDASFAKKILFSSDYLASLIFSKNRIMNA